MVFAIHQHKSASSVFEPPILNPSPHSIPLGCPRAPVWVPCFIRFHILYLEKLDRDIPKITTLSDFWKFCPRIFYNIAFVCAQSCQTLCDPMDCSPASFLCSWDFARILEWVAISSSRGSCRPRDLTHISWISCLGSFFTNKSPGKPFLW